MLFSVQIVLNPTVGEQDGWRDGPIVLYLTAVSPQFYKKDKVILFVDIV